MIRSRALTENPPHPRRADSLRNFPAYFGLGRLGAAISQSAVSALSSAIQTQEGYYPGSVAYQNNNPGNLMYAGQPGASAGAGGFASFSTYAAGLAALQNQITLDATRGTDVNGNPTTTVAELLTSWAPPSENDTAAYIASVSLSTGYDPDAPLSSLGAAAPLSPLDASVAPDLSFLTDSSVDLSSVGLGSAVPLIAVAAGGLVLAWFLARR